MGGQSYRSNNKIKKRPHPLSIIRRRYERKVSTVSRAYGTCACRTQGLRSSDRAALAHENVLHKVAIITKKVDVFPHFFNEQCALYTAKILRPPFQKRMSSRYHHLMPRKRSCVVPVGTRRATVGRLFSPVEVTGCLQRSVPRLQGKRAGAVFCVGALRYSPQAFQQGALEKPSQRSSTGREDRGKKSCPTNACFLIVTAPVCRNQAIISVSTGGARPYFLNCASSAALALTL